MKSVKNRKMVTGIAILLLLASCLLIGCTTTQKQVVKPNDTVKVHYSAALASTGEVFESSYNSSPIQFVAGMGQVIQGFDDAVIGMSPGETKTGVFIPADKAYGQRNMSLIFTLAKTGPFADYTAKPGVITYVTTTLPNGQTTRYPIISSNDTTVTIDTNHPLAGQDLVFNITLVEIVKK